MAEILIKNLPAKYEAIWQECLRLFSEGRPSDDIHARDTVEFILNYQGQLKFDQDILVPTAMMHDIGHTAILPEHFKFVTGGMKLVNSKLVHMLTGAKIAKNILAKVVYDPVKSKEIVDIISIHDSYQLSGINLEEIYNTDNKKIFHDIDMLDMFSQERLKKFKGLADAKTLKSGLEKNLKAFFYDEFRIMAEKRFGDLKL